ncbi:MAG: UvrD-helicase domain-containing protein [Candidatus Tectomicrobia bacterium]|uniref:DNA 3'-5' helicase n=1 Tax=Tectimicrobiota bacterium TaxID=2528274 RepID=A0A932HVS2_UNCTE|nr:UvrD-helicase domain-containing protein [Candidatus Tectomicrobia bacterium]
MSRRKPLADQEARDLAVTWTEGPVLVEAGAGTGKTRLLVDRVVHLVESGGARLDAIAAITFTLKAAAELRERVRKGLRDRLGGARDPGARERLRAALEGIDQAQISTIHGFALRLLRERALEAGLAPGAGEVDIVAHEALRDRLWQEWLAERFTRGDEGIEAFLSLGLSLGHLTALRDSLLELPELREGFPRARDLSSGELMERVRACHARWAALADAECLDRSDKAYAEVARVAEWMGALPRASAPDLLRSLWRPSLRLNKKVGSPKRWSGGIKPFRDGYDAFLREACAEAGQEILAGAIASLRDFAGRLGRAAAEEGLLTYQDILHRAVRLVRGSAGARGEFRRRWAHFLVDEFQDTDPLQVELVFLLASGEPCPEDWRGARLAGGGLFLVGDPKQAIYRFRRADIAVYEEAKRIVERSGGKVLAITQNFRSAPGVIQVVNGIFGRLIAKDGDFQAAYIPLEADREEEGPRVLLLAPKDADAKEAQGEEDEAERSSGEEGEAPEAGKPDGAEARRKKEAALLASAVRRLVEDERPEIPAPGGGRRPLGYGDVALLFRARTGYAEYEEAFRAAGVPVVSEGGRGFYDRAEVAAAAAVLRAVLRPADKLALAAALRSPLYGFADTDLARAFMPGLSPSPGWAAAAKEIGELHALRGGMSARALLGEIFRRTRAFELFLSTFQGEQRAANLLKLLDLAFEYEGGGARAAEEFSAFLDAQVALGKKAREPEAEAGGAGAEAVRFMSMHSAKGLEFPVVALADLGGREGFRKRVWLADRSENRVEIGFYEKNGKENIWSVESLGFARAEERERRFWEAEQVRLLYVAATRARDYLMLPLFSDRNDAWALMAKGGVTIEALRKGGFGPVRLLEMETPRAEEPESYFRLPPSAFEPDERKIDEGRRMQAELEGRLAELKAPPAWRPPLAPSRLAEHEEGSRESERYAGADGTGRERSLAFGALAHALLAGVGSIPPGEWEAQARALAREKGLDEAAAREALELIRKGAAGRLLQRAAAAPRAWREFSFFARVEGRLVRGFADLVFEEGEGLVIGDFKTDDAKAGDVPARAARYAPQGAAYALCLEAASGKKVKEVVFSFLRPGAEHAFPVDEAFRERGRRAVREDGQGTPADIC